MRQIVRGGRSEDFARAQKVRAVDLESLEPRVLFAGAPKACAPMTGPVRGPVVHRRFFFALQHGGVAGDRDRLYTVDATGAKHPPVIVLGGGGHVGRGHGKKGGATPGLEHPGAGGSRGQTDGDGGRSSGPPVPTGPGASVGGVVSSAADSSIAQARLIESLNSDPLFSPGSIVASAGQSGSLVFASSSPSVRSEPESYISGLAASILPAAQMLTKPAVTATFSMVPLAIREFELLSREISAAVADAPQPAGAPSGRQNHSQGALVTQISDAVESTKAVMVNLFHVDAMATFNDAMQSFIDDSAAAPAAHPIGHRRAWTITAVGVAADLALITYWFALRKPSASDEAKTADPGGIFLPFGAEPVQA
jgi:hypothetical protein